MRIRVAYNNTSGILCESVGYGEVEDYEVNIGAAAGAQGVVAKLTKESKENISLNSTGPKVNIFPNPTSGIMNVSVLPELVGAEISIIGLDGSEILSQIIVDEKTIIDLRNSSGPNLESVHKVGCLD